MAIQNHVNHYGRFRVRVSSGFSLVGGLGAETGFAQPPKPAKARQSPGTPGNTREHPDITRRDPPPPLGYGRWRPKSAQAAPRIAYTYTACQSVLPGTRRYDPPAPLGYGRLSQIWAANGHILVAVADRSTHL